MGGLSICAPGGVLEIVCLQGIVGREGSLYTISALATMHSQIVVLKEGRVTGPNLRCVCSQELGVHSSPLPTRDPAFPLQTHLI